MKPSVSILVIFVAIIIATISPALPSYSQGTKSLGRFEIGADFVNPSAFSPWAFAEIFTIDSITADPDFIENLRTVGITMPSV